MVNIMMIIKNQLWSQLTFECLLHSGNCKHIIKVHWEYKPPNVSLRYVQFYYTHLSNPYMSTGKIIALARQTFVGKVMSLLFNIMSRLVIGFLPMSKSLISWLQSPSAVILEPKKTKSVTLSIVFPSICHEMMEPESSYSLEGKLWPT